jgi:tRNA nucleotidyltransferase (CCA-adding enzyme)
MGIRGVGPTVEAAFEQAAMAMAAIVADLSTVEPCEPVEVYCSQPELDLLLVDWLNSLLYQAAIRRMVFCKFNCQISNGQLSGKAWGEPIDPAKHVLLVEVKAATLACLDVYQDEKGRWVAQCIVDV